MILHLNMWKGKMEGGKRVIYLFCSRGYYIPQFVEVRHEGRENSNGGCLCYIWGRIGKYFSKKYGYL